MVVIDKGRELEKLVAGGKKSYALQWITLIVVASGVFVTISTSRLSERIETLEQIQEQQAKQLRLQRAELDSLGNRIQDPEVYDQQDTLLRYP